jgi:hypothetical protein
VQLLVFTYILTKCTVQEAKNKKSNFVVMLDIVDSVIIVQLGYGVIKGMSIFCRYTQVLLTEEYRVAVNSEDLIPQCI